MAANTRFCTGIHTLVLLAADPDVQQTSDEIARKLNTNPVVIRRVLSLLAAGGPGQQPEGTKRRFEAGQAGQGDPAGRYLPCTRAGFDLPWLEPYRGTGGQGERGARKSIYRDAQEALEAELDGTTLNQLAKKSEKKKK